MNVEPMERLAAEVKLLNELLQKPEHGLMTWMVAVASRMTAVQKLLDELLGPA